jgi:hypothetical protein
MGATSCQIRFRRGSAVTVFGGNSLNPDTADRRARYQTFVAELHRRLGPDDRARISFIAGYGHARLYFLLVAAVVSAVFWVTVTVGTLLGFAPRRIGAAIGLSIGAVLDRRSVPAAAAQCPAYLRPEKPDRQCQGSVDR